MSREVSIFQNQTGVAVGERKLSKLGQSLASASMSRRIQTNTNGTFKRLINGEQIGNALRGEIEVIIVGALPKVSPCTTPRSTIRTKKPHCLTAGPTWVTNPRATCPRRHTATALTAR